MGNHSITEAKNRFSELIDRALKGEAAVITRCGQPVVELMPASKPAKPAKPITPEALDWLKARRDGRRKAREDAGSLMSRMRDEEWNRFGSISKPKIPSGRRGD